MKKMEVVRDVFQPDWTLGRLFYDARLLGFTCEDTDRHLEDGKSKKVQDKTAIPRGEYDVVLSYSFHFEKMLPEIVKVPNFTGVRIHGGNTDKDTSGCVLLGMARTDTGCANCAPAMARLIAYLEEAEAVGEKVRLTVR